MIKTILSYNRKYISLQAFNNKINRTSRHEEIIKAMKKKPWKINVCINRRQSKFIVVDLCYNLTPQPEYS